MVLSFVTEGKQEEKIWIFLSYCYGVLQFCNHFQAQNIIYALYIVTMKKRFSKLLYNHGLGKGEDKNKIEKNVLKCHIFWTI